eukprot:3156037-Rhodomonas_salina.1
MPLTRSLTTAPVRDSLRGRKGTPRTDAQEEPAGSDRPVSHGSDQVHGDFELSIPGAVQALRSGHLTSSTSKTCLFSLEVYGAGKIELVPCYLLLAEANLGLGRHKQAEEYLSLANWSILKNPDCSNRTKSQLYRNFGKLYASQGKHEEALRQLANDVYFSSLQVGPEHIETAGGYYYLATVFYLQRQLDCALAMCDKVVEIWFKHVSALIDPSKTSGGCSDVLLADSQTVEGQEPPEPLGESQVRQRWPCANLHVHVRANTAVCVGNQLMDGLQTLTKIVVSAHVCANAGMCGADGVRRRLRTACGVCRCRSLCNDCTVWRRQSAKSALREESMGADHVTTGEALYTVSLVYMYANDNQRALQLLDKAYTIYYFELGPDSNRTLELAQSIRDAGGVPQEPTERPRGREEGGA